VSARCGVSDLQEGVSAQSPGRTVKLEWSARRGGRRASHTPDAPRHFERQTRRTSLGSETRAATRRPPAGRVAHTSAYFQGVGGETLEGAQYNPSASVTGVTLRQRSVRNKCKMQKIVRGSSSERLFPRTQYVSVSVSTLGRSEKMRRGWRCCLRPSRASPGAPSALMGAASSHYTSGPLLIG